MKDLLGRVNENPYAKGSSKPKEEQALESLVIAKISSDFVFKDGSKKVDVDSISVISITVNEGDYIAPNKEKYNHSFEGDAQVGIKTPNLIATNLKGIKGFFNLTGERTIELYPEIQIMD